MAASSRFVRLGGVAAISSAALALLSFVLYLLVVGGDRISEAATSAAFFLPSGAQLLAMALLLIGLVAMFVRQADAFGALGLTGFVFALLGTTLAAGAAWSQVFVVPRLSEVAPAVADRGAGSVLAGFMLSFLMFGGAGFCSGWRRSGRGCFHGGPSSCSSWGRSSRSCRSLPGRSS